MSKRNILIGKTLLGVTLEDDRSGLTFDLGEEILHVGVDADCCSYTWIESIELPALGFPATVFSVDDLELPHYPDSEFHPNSDVEAYYGCKISTDKGEIIIDYRNDSNGYYGGSLWWPEGTSKKN